MSAKIPTIPLSNTFHIERGTSKRARVPLYLASTKRRPTSVAGWTGTVTVTRSMDDADVTAPLLERAVDSIDAMSKDVLIDFTWEESDALPEGELKWTVRVVDADGRHYAPVPGGADFVVTPRGSSAP